LEKNIHQDAIKRFWQGYLATLPETDRMGKKMPDAWAFGLGSEMADDLGALVASGIKQATASLLWEYESEGSKLPEAGDLSIILDGRGHPLCIIQTLKVEIKPFDKVDEKFAYDEGEGDRSLNYWREAHWRFFSRTCEEISHEPAEDMPVVCERFKMVWPDL
jgi:uncharacterized protein YhfF